MFLCCILQVLDVSPSRQQPEDQLMKKGGCVNIPRGAIPPTVAFPVSDVRIKQGEMPKLGAMPNSDETSQNAQEVANESGGEQEESMPVKEVGRHPTVPWGPRVSPPDSS